MSSAVINHGRIKKLPLPDNWHENDTSSGTISASDRIETFTAGNTGFDTAINTASDTAGATEGGAPVQKDFSPASDTTSDTESSAVSSSEADAPALDQGFALREFKPDGLEDVRLCLYYRGHPVSDDSGQALNEVLKEKPHSLTRREISDLAEVLDDIAYPEVFSMLSIRTEDLNGRRVLVAEGRWQQQQWDTYSLFTSCDETGTVIQQIYFLAPVRQYASFIATVKRCFGAIEWSD